MFLPKTANMKIKKTKNSEEKLRERERRKGGNGEEAREKKRIVE